MIVVDLNPADVPSVVPKLLRTFPEVKINIGISGVQFDLLHTLLQVGDRMTSYSICFLSFLRNHFQTSADSDFVLLEIEA